MFSKSILLFLYVIRLGYCDWVSDWMTPVQDEFGSVKDLNRRNDDAELKMFEDEELRAIPMQGFTIPQTNEPSEAAPEVSYDTVTSGLRNKLLATLENAKALAETLKTHILLVTEREATLKDAIVNGRLGVTSVTVNTLNRASRSYLIRDGAWAHCNGVIQPPANNPYSNKQGPRCLGLETPSKPDPCVFNSVIKYETVPARRRLEYAEDDFLCLRPGFNNTIEQYLSVPRRVVNDTCKNGIVRSLEDNLSECGLRVLSEYAYYPGAGAAVAREYCAPGPACPLLAAWHVSNATIENFEFLKDEPNFKKYFIRSGYEHSFYSL